MDKCPTVELGVQDTHLRGKKEKEEHLILLKKFQKIKKGMYPLTIVITIITIHHSFFTHAHLDLTY